MRKSNNQKVRKAMKSALKSGWTQKEGKRHIKMFAPDGKNIVTISCTATDPAAERNILADFKRAGLKI